MLANSFERYTVRRSIYPIRRTYYKADVKFSTLLSPSILFTCIVKRKTSLYDMRSSAHQQKYFPPAVDIEHATFAVPFWTVCSIRNWAIRTPHVLQYVKQTTDIYTQNHSYEGVPFSWRVLGSFFYRHYICLHIHCLSQCDFYTLNTRG